MPRMPLASEPGVRGSCHTTDPKGALGPAEITTSEAEKSTSGASQRHSGPLTLRRNGGGKSMVNGFLALISSLLHLIGASGVVLIG